MQTCAYILTFNLFPFFHRWHDILNTLPSRTFILYQVSLNGLKKNSWYKKKYVSHSIYNTSFLQVLSCSNDTNDNANNHLNATACYQPKEIISSRSEIPNEQRLIILETQICKSTNSSKSRDYPIRAKNRDENILCNPM